MAFSHEVYTLRINLYSHKNINFLKYITFTCSVNSNTNQDYSVCCITSCLYVLKSKARQTAASWYGHHQTHAQNHLTRAMPGNHEQLLFVSNLSRTSKQPMSFLTVFLRIPCHFDSQSPKYKKKKTKKGTKNSVDCAKLQAISLFRKCACICDQYATACTL